MTCYLCGQRQVYFFAQKNGYVLLRCPDCGLIFYEFSGNYQQFLNDQYRQGYFQGQEDLRSYFDYAEDKFIVTLDSPKTNSKISFETWLKANYINIPLDRFLIK